MSELERWLPKERHCAGCGAVIPDGQEFVARLDPREWHRACYERTQAHHRAVAAATRQREEDRRQLDRQFRIRRF